MIELINYFSSLPTAIETGLIYSIVAMGVFITFRILNFPDMSVTGVFPLGGFVFAAFALSPNGFFGIMNPFVGLIFVALAGAGAGFVTGFLNVKLGIDSLIAGIIVMTGLYSVNLRILGAANVVIPAQKTIFEVIKYDNLGFFIIYLTILLIVKAFYDHRIKENKYAIITFVVYVLLIASVIIYTINTQKMKMIIAFGIVLTIKLIIDYLMTSKLGFVLRALGDNKQLVVSLGVNEKKLTIQGLMISNALVALAGSVFGQYMKTIEVTAIETLTVGLAGIILGSGLLKKNRMINDMTIVIFGSVVYYNIVNIALQSNNWSRNLYKALGFSAELKKILEIRPSDIKIITALILIILLYVDYRKRNNVKKRGAKNAGV